jgi:hypothetical protein
MAGVVTPLSRYRWTCALQLLGRAVDDESVGHLVRHRGGRCLAVALGPVLPHRYRAARCGLATRGTRGYTGTVCTPRSHLGHGPGGVGVGGGADEDPRHDLLSGPPSCTYGMTVGTSSAASQLMRRRRPPCRPGAACPGAARPPAASAAPSGTMQQPETVHSERLVLLGHLLPGQRHPQEAHHVPYPLERLVERDAVQRCTYDVRGGADAQREPAGERRRPGRPRSARSSGRAGERGTMAVPRRSVGAQAAASVSG